MTGIDNVKGVYPPIKIGTSGLLKVDGSHCVWWEISGAPSGVPIIYLHGGPGNPPGPEHRRLFDPQFYRLVVMHQRGCGKSIPSGSLESNTTLDLIQDIEALRAHLGIGRWLVVGGSWGSCLSLAYGSAFPERCLGFRLRGVFLGSPREKTWWWDGTRRTFPDAFAELLDHLPPEERDDPEAAYKQRVMSSDLAVSVDSAMVFLRFSLKTTPFAGARSGEVAPWSEWAAKDAVAFARLFFHYSTNGWFLKDNQITDGIARLSHLPCIIINGRYDVTTPCEAAWLLHQRWPQSQLVIVNGAAHAELDPEMAQAILNSHERLKAFV